MNLPEKMRDWQPTATGLGAGMILADVHLTGAALKIFNEWCKKPDNKPIADFDYANGDMARDGNYLTSPLREDDHLYRHWNNIGYMPSIMTSEDARQLVTAEVITLVPNDFRRDILYFDRQDPDTKEFHYICWGLWNKK